MPFRLSEVDVNNDDESEFNAFYGTIIYGSTFMRNLKNDKAVKIIFGFIDIKLAAKCQCMGFMLLF